ncbi:MAG TPA: alpha/beta hydrolase [Longimicrobiaceae bacterium]|nr:alpha/beta hydrolase [Longimicrobiaceae bacterium]
MTGAAGEGARLGEAAVAWSRARRVRAGEWWERYREAGTGPPVVLVHGLGISADYWFRNGPPLAAAGFRVLAPDLPGFGRTEGPQVLSVPEQAAALDRWAEAMGLGTAVYVGHSLSCQCTLELAVARPERVRGLVLSSPTGAPLKARILHQALGFLRDVPREEPKLVPFVAEAYLRAGPVRVLRTWRRGAEHDPLPLLPRVRAPSLVIVGRRDPVVPPEFAESLAAGLPRGRLVWIEDAAHAVHFSRAEEFNRAVLEFLGEL